MNGEFMYFSSPFKTLDSIKFLIKIAQKVTKPPSYTTFEYEGCSANYYCQNKKKCSKGLMIIFIGVNQLGNTDPRYERLINGLISIGYNCLILQLQPFVDIIAPVQKDFDLVTTFLNYVLTSKMDTENTISFIGPSTSCLYMIKVGTSELLKNKIRSMCFISPFSDPLSSLSLGGILKYIFREGDIKYIYGLMSVGGSFPSIAKAYIVYFYTLYFGDEIHKHVTPMKQYTISESELSEIKTVIKGKNYQEDFIQLNEQLKAKQCLLPNAIKHSMSFCEQEGTQILATGVDPDFGNCVDIFSLAETNKIKPLKLNKYSKLISDY